MAKIYTPQNMTTSEVKKMQQGLVDAGYGDMLGSSGVDGIWGANTSAALKAFKADTGGSNTYGNTVGKETFDKLYGTGSSGSSTSYDNLPVFGGGVSASGSTGNSSALDGWSSLFPTIAPSTIKPYADAILSPEGMGAIKDAQNITSMYNSQIGGLEDNTNQYITQLQGSANQANAALEEARANALAGIKSVYDDSARNYYRMYKTQEKELPEHLSSVGATGGASESAALRLMNSYSDNMYKNETARNQDISSLDEEYFNAVASNSQKLGSQIADAYFQLANQTAQLKAENQAATRDIISTYLNKYNQRKEDEKKNDWRSGATYLGSTDTGSYTSTPKPAAGSGGGGGGVVINTPAYNYYYRVASGHLADDRNADGRIGGEQAVLNYINNIPSSSLSNSQKIQLAKDLGLGKK